MNPHDAVKKVNNFFVYKSDLENYNFYEVWDVLDEDTPGDCEDYALTVLWYISDQSKLTFLYNLLLNPKCSIWMVKIKATGQYHAVLRYKNLYVDNITKIWFHRLDDEYYNYDWKYPIIPPIIALKFLISLPFIYANDLKR